MAHVCKLYQGPAGRLVLFCANHAYEVVLPCEDGAGIRFMRCVADSSGHTEGPWKETDAAILSQPGYQCVADYVPWTPGQADTLTLHVGVMNAAAQRYLGVNLQGA
jgi:hypothetical protein